MLDEDACDVAGVIAVIVIGDSTNGVCRAVLLCSVKSPLIGRGKREENDGEARISAAGVGEDE